MTASISTAATLSPLVNVYKVSAGPPKTIIVPKASQLAALQEVTITGTLLKKQIETLDLSAGTRTAHLAGNNGVYKPTPGDGDLHFCLGTKQLKPHVACELQNAKAFVPLFNQAVGAKISVTDSFAVSSSIRDFARMTTPTVSRFIQCGQSRSMELSTLLTSTCRTRIQFIRGSILIR